MIAASGRTNDVQIRGAEPRLPGVGVYITGFTPFDRTLRFECV